MEIRIKLFIIAFTVGIAATVSCIKICFSQKQKRREHAVFETERLYFCPFIEDDLENLYNLYTDEDVMKQIKDTLEALMGGKFDKTNIQKMLTHFIEHQKKYGYGYWAVFEKKTGNFVGRIDLRKVEDYPCVADAGYILCKKHWGKGYATESMRSLIDWAFANTNIKTITATTTPEHTASRKIMEKVGMQFFRNFELKGIKLVQYKILKESNKLPSEHNETITLKWYDLSCEKQFAEIFQGMGQVYANAFGPFYPEAGLGVMFPTKDLLTNLPLQTRKGFSRFQKTGKERIMPPEEKEAVLTFLQKHAQELSLHSKEYFLNDWNNKDRIKLIQALSKQNKVFTLVALKNDKPVGIILFSDMMLNWNRFYDAGGELDKDEKCVWLLAIDPIAQKRGLSRKLIFSILQLFPDTKAIKLKTDIEVDPLTGRPKLENACKVYEHLDFKKYNELNLKYDPKKRQYFIWKKK